MHLTELPSGNEDTAQGVTLGTLTTLAEIEARSVIKRHYPLLAHTAAVAATPQLRNMATLGGNLLQRPWCWYFRNPLLYCWLKGGAGAVGLGCAGAVAGQRRDTSRAPGECRPQSANCPEPRSVLS